MGISVLLVEDNPKSAEMLLRILKGFHMEGRWADTGNKAIAEVQNAITQNRPYGLFLVDWRLGPEDGVELAKRIKKIQGEHPGPVILMVGGPSSDLTLRIKAAGIDNMIFKPVKQSTLLDAVMEAVSPSQALRRTGEKPVLSAIKGARVLLAEDNKANQMVAKAVLAEYGIGVDVAPNGRIAVDMALKSSYDAVLMDLQMPEMCGFEATEQIRRSLPRHELPIIAMTANAMKGDREKCLEAGMDDYVGKPIDARRLVRTLEKWIKPRSRIHGGKTTIQDRSTDQLMDGAGVDIREAVSRLGISAKAFQSMLNDFLKERERQLAKIRRALSSGRMPEVERLAHALSGAAGNLGVILVQKTARDLEKAAAKADSAASETALDLMEQAFHKVASGVGKREKPVEDRSESLPSRKKKASLFRQLAEHLDRFDPVGTQEVIQSISELGITDENTPGFGELREYVDELKYEKAVPIARGLGSLSAAKVDTV